MYTTFIIFDNRVSHMHKKLYVSINLLLIKKLDNILFLSVEEYNKRLEEVKHSETSLNTLGLKKISKDLPTLTINIVGILYIA